MMLLEGDCLELMGDIPNSSVDMVLCDLPYGTINWKSPHTWDSAIPMQLLWDHYWRILSSRGVVCLFGNEPFSTLVKYSCLEKYKYDWVWVKTRKGGFANAKVKPLKEYELVMVFSRGTTSPGRKNNMTYNPQGLVRVDKTVRPTGKSRLGITMRPNNTKEYVQEFTNYPSDVLKFDSVSAPIHPTEKPVPLLEYLIRTYTNEGDTVLDNTMGSGSTGEAAFNTNRRFIGIEKDPSYFEMARNRIYSLI